ncbi:hypothetical protein JTE90_013667 [Oedothorax gibbosus]|uniref:Uncharacterized protein n=1 Tax=Oedothorax gibbosus TaxID=931172 RepID=A0AAV6VBV2_9ARAC|nr:hypothetical protein JTE90_013667 [Oedothorax gibbosus]
MVAKPPSVIDNPSIMNLLIVTTTLLVGVVALASAQGGRKGPPGPPPPGGPGGRHGPPPPPPSFFDAFPACQSMAEAMKKSREDLHGKKEIGPEACKGQGPEAHHNCMRMEMFKVRCKAPEKPSPDCVAQVTQFLQGAAPCEGFALKAEQ